MIYYKDKKYSFIELFNEKNGFLIRSNILTDGVESDKQATQRSFPELIDIGIMGHCHAARSGICKKAGVDCYQNAINCHNPNMGFEEYKRLIKQCKNRTFQVALGGAGDPNKHENFYEIMALTREMGMVPNLTTSGYDLHENEVQIIKQYCGAVAVSFYSTLGASGEETNNHTIDAIQQLVDAGCIVNIHYVLSSDSIKEATIRIRDSLFPQGINAVVFLLYKPIGAGKQEKVLDYNNKEYIELLKRVDSNELEFKVGFDTCQSPGLLCYNSTINAVSIDTCEAARFSMYIDSNSIACPCSFGHDQPMYCLDLKSISIEDAWNSEQFQQFRDKQETMCSSCKVNNCLGCALDINLNICGQTKS